MSFDVNQLPIPDWGLHCPKCSYPLRGLPSHRCPECGASLMMQEIVQTWTRLRDPTYSGQELPIPDFGLACPHCGMALAGTLTHRCVQCAESIDMEAFRPNRKWFEADLWTGANPVAGNIDELLATDMIPYTRAIGRTASDVFLARGASVGVLYVSSEFFFDFLAHMRQMRIDRATVAEKRPDWTCPSCAEIVPGNFEICWNCGVNRAGALQFEEH